MVLLDLYQAMRIRECPPTGRQACECRESNSYTMRLFKRLERLVDHILEQKVNALTFVIVFLGMLYLRCFIEQFIAQSRQLTPTEMLVEFIHNLYFFLLTILLSWIVVSLVLKMKPQRLSYLFAWATWLMILPPILDMAKTGGQIYWSFYIVGSLQDLAMQFITIFGHFPSGIVYFGTRITFILAIIGISAFVAIKTRNIVKTIQSGNLFHQIDLALDINAVRRRSDFQSSCRRTNNRALKPSELLRRDQNQEYF